MANFLLPKSALKSYYQYNHYSSSTSCLCWYQKRTNMSTNSRFGFEWIWMSRKRNFYPGNCFV